MNGIGEVLSKDSLSVLPDHQLMVLMGGGKGDEGKGGDAYAMAHFLDYDMVISPIGGPNAGHTVHCVDGGQFVGHNLPGSSATGKKTFLGQGKYIHISGLQKEHREIQRLGKNPPIKIANGAHVLLDSLHRKIDTWIEESKKRGGNDVGTTKSGVGPGVALRAVRSGISIDMLVNMEHAKIEGYVKELIAPWNSDIGLKAQDIIKELQKEQSVLKASGFKIVSNEYAQNKYKEGTKILVEGAQSPSLGMYGGAYPYNTSPDTSFLGILSSLGITPNPDRVSQILVSKLFPTAVGKHIFPERISHIFKSLEEREKQFGKETGEYGATTQRSRMIAFPSPGLLEDYIKNDPYVVAVSIRKFDVLSQFQKIMELPKLPIVVGYEANGIPVLDEVAYSIEGIINQYKEVIGKKIPFILGYGPKPQDSYIIT